MVMCSGSVATRLSMGRIHSSRRKDGLKRNQFGGVIGGPIRTNKLFFFGGYQGTTTRQTPLPVQAFVPTAAMRAGDFSAYIANNCPGAANLGRGVFGPGVVANGRLTLPLSPAALNIASRFPQTSDPCGAIFTGNILHENQYQVPVENRLPTECETHGVRALSGHRHQHNGSV